jgi:hypothetical protein
MGRKKGKRTETSKWLTPKEAIAVVKASGVSDPLGALMDHIRGNILPVVASRHSEAAGGQEPVVSDKPTTIPVNYWNRLQGDASLWSHGTAHFKLGGGLDDWRDIRCFGIKFPAQKVHDQFPASDEPREAGAPSEASPDDTKPKLAPGALEAWYEAYKKAYTPAERGLEHAYRHAKTAFPEKQVVRDRVRELLPSGNKPGPKGPRG